MAGGGLRNPGSQGQMSPLLSGCQRKEEGAEVVRQAYIRQARVYLYVQSSICESLAGVNTGVF